MPDKVTTYIMNSDSQCRCLGCLLTSRKLANRPLDEYRANVRDYILEAIDGCQCGECVAPFDEIVTAGTYKDVLLMFCNTKLESSMLEYYAKVLVRDYETLKSGLKDVSLAAKWAPTEGHALDNKFKLVAKLCVKLNMSKSQYRKMIVMLRKQMDLVETAMSDNKWSTIKYSRLPENVEVKYARSFMKHDQDRYTSWLVEQ